MSQDASFQDLIRRVRDRDERAAEELVRRYEPIIRVAVRVRLSDPALRSLLDSTDICQSVLFQFFRRASLGQFELDSPDQLLKLLVTMARNKLTNYAVQQRAARRDRRRLRQRGASAADLAAPGPGVSEIVANQELLEKFQEKLSAEERDLADQRAAGRSWAEIAVGTGESPDALRMRLTRAVERITLELGLDD